MPLFRYLKQVISEFGQDKAGQLSAALAYTSIFAIAPLMLLVISVVGFFLGEKAVAGQLYDQLQGVVGSQAAKTIQDAVIHTHQSQHGTLAFVVGFVGTLLAAAALTGQLQHAFDVIFSVVPNPKAGFKNTVYTKFKNALILIIGSLVITASLLASALISSVGKGLQARYGTPAFTLQVTNIAVSLAVFILIIYLMYRVLPDVVLPRKNVAAASVVIGLLFLLGKVILGYVIGHNGTASAYGAAASLIVLLLWFYYMGQIIFIGAEGIKVYLNNRGHIYKSKRYTLRRKTINIEADNNLAGRSAEAFAHGFTKKIRNPKK
jgi:membrane protein